MSKQRCDRYFSTSFHIFDTHSLAPNNKRRVDKVRKASACAKLLFPTLHKPCLFINTIIQNFVVKISFDMYTTNI